MSDGKAAWVAVDWGTSNLRAWIMGTGGEVLATPRAPAGMNSLDPDGFEPALLDLLGPWLGSERLPVIACGMVGAKQGWREAPYVAVPCAPLALAQAERPPVRDRRLDVRILPGVSQLSPPDVMRGEETQIAGYLRGDPEFDGVICLPGTHSKWVHVSAGEIVSFRTFMTGELFDLLSRQSVLRHSVTQEDGWDDAAFLSSVDDMMSNPQRLAARLFGLRAGALLEGTDPATVRARLSGLLLGMEIAGARDYWLGRDIMLIGAPTLTARYRTALQAQGAAVRETDGADIVLAGLTAAYMEASA